MFNIDEFIIAIYGCVDAHLESLLTQSFPALAVQPMGAAAMAHR